MQQKKKKVLVFIDWFLPGYKAGGPVRSVANMVEYLGKDYQFYIVTRDTDYLETQPYDTVVSDSWNTYMPNVEVYYTSNSQQSTRQWQGLMNDIKPDAVYINGVYSLMFSLMPLYVAKKMKVPTIVAARGMLAKSAIDVKRGKKRLFLRLARLLGLYKGVVFHATNAKEAADIKSSIGTSTKVIVADNLPRRELPAFKTITKEAGQLKIVSLARIAPEKNTLYALERLAELQPTFGEIVLDIYGQIYDEAYWHQCLKVISKLPDTIKVEYKGTVEAELVASTIQDYHLLFMPTRGENFGHVILESLSAGRPVLISDQTPWRNLEKEHCGWDIDLMKSTDYTPNAFGAALAKLTTMEQKEFDGWCEGARRRAEGFVSESKLIEGYRKLF